MTPQGEDLSSEPPQPWMADAICHSVDPELWFPTKGRSDKPAKRVCYQCPPVADCAAYALDRPELDGVWGGLSNLERRQLRKDTR